MSFFADTGIAHPALPRAGEDAQPWTEKRGVDVRCWDRRQGHLVWGPQHPFLEPSDILVTNGVLRAVVGPGGTPPHLSVAAFRNGSWREVGALCFADPTQAGNELMSARLVTLTTDLAVVSLACKALGEVRVGLQRGERMVRVLHGAAIASPSVSRTVLWLGSPPHKALADVSSQQGFFDDGIDVDNRAEFWWPRSARPRSWATSVRWKPSDGTT